MPGTLRQARPHTAIAAFVSAAVLLLAMVGGPPASAADSDFCAGGAPAPCVLSATVNGTAVTAAHETWDITVARTGTDVLWNVQTTTGSYELGAGSLDDDWVITFDVGTLAPRVSFIHGKAADTQRLPQSDGTYRLRVSGTPIVLSAGCNQAAWPWTCPSTATEEWNGYLGGMATNYNTWEDVAQREAMYGMNYFTNIDATSVPPQIVHDSTTNTDYLMLELASPHFRQDAATLIKGFVRLRIPNAFLKNTYGIDDPSSLTGTGLVPIVSGSSTGSGTITVADDPDGGAVMVSVTDMTFSARLVRIKRGVVTPTRPTNLRARRVSEHRGRVGFDAARARGSRITGYRTRCVSLDGAHVRTATASASPITVGELRSSTAYDCRVRALSKAGPGAWSTGTARIPRTVS